MFFFNSWKKNSSNFFLEVFYFKLKSSEFFFHFFWLKKSNRKIELLELFLEPTRKTRNLFFKFQKKRSFWPYVPRRIFQVIAMLPEMYGPKTKKQSSKVKHVTITLEHCQTIVPRIVDGKVKKKIKRFKLKSRIVRRVWKEEEVSHWERERERENLIE